MAGINQSTGLAHPNDLGKTVELLRKLVEAGHVAQHPNEMIEFLKKAGVRERAAREISLGYEALVLAAGYDGGPYWKEDIIAKL